MRVEYCLAVSGFFYAYMCNFEHCPYFFQFFLYYLPGTENGEGVAVITSIHSGGASKSLFKLGPSPLSGVDVLVVTSRLDLGCWEKACSIRSRAVVLNLDRSRQALALSRHYKYYP